MDKFYLDEVNLETCWPAVYLVGRPIHSQGSLVDHVLARPTLLPSPINVDPSNPIQPDSLTVRLVPTIVAKIVGTISCLFCSPPLD